MMRPLPDSFDRAYRRALKEDTYTVRPAYHRDLDRDFAHLDIAMGAGVIAAALITLGVVLYHMMT